MDLTFERAVELNGGTHGIDEENLRYELEQYLRMSERYGSPLFPIMSQLHAMVIMTLPKEGSLAATVWCHVAALAQMVERSRGSGVGKVHLNDVAAILQGIIARHGRVGDGDDLTTEHETQDHDPTGPASRFRLMHAETGEDFTVTITRGWKP